MINENNKNSWCVNAFHSMSANNDGSSKMCCMISDEYNSFENSTKDYYIGIKSISDNFNNPHSIKIRQDLETGIRNSACRLCWEEEDGGRKSKRMRDNERYLYETQYKKLSPYEGLAKLELNLGNNCNIKCRTCHPMISSTWMKESYDLDHSSSITFKEYSSTMKKFHQQYDDESPFWNDLKNNLSTIRQFDFYGGEPFLSKKMWEILGICVEQDYSKEIELHYNTNGTIWPKEIDFWKNFKNINLSFSIDGVGEQFEYMRFPAKWDVVIENMKKARNLKLEGVNISLSWCVTLSPINIYYLPEIVDYYYREFNDFGIYLNLVHNPIHFNVSKLSPAAKNAVLEKLKTIENHPAVKYQLPGIIGFITNGKYDVDIWNNFKETIQKHDRYREQRFEITFREYSNYI